MTQTSKQIGQRGKSAEKIVTDIFTRWNLEKAEFAFDRLPDARAARGALKAQLCDFIVQITNGDKSRFVMVEVKETKHAYRLAKDKLSQLPVMHKWLKAGAGGVVLIHHTEDNVWRLVRTANFEIGLPSWDLRDYPTWSSAEAALTAYQPFSCFRKGEK